MPPIQTLISWHPVSRVGSNWRLIDLLKRAARSGGCWLASHAEQPVGAGAILTELSPEIDLLLATARAELEEADRVRLSAAVRRDPDWHGLIAAALAHGTAPFLCHHLLETVPEALPPDLAEAAAAHRAAARQAFAAGEAELLALIAALARAGIEALPFKGPSLARQAYGPAAASLRNFRDLDLLIRSRDADRCLSALSQLGFRSPVADLNPATLAAYRAHNGQDILFAEADVQHLPVEPHWAFAPRNFGTRLEPDALWPRAVTLCLEEGATLRTLSPEDALLVAALHGGKEQWARLIWVADVAALLRRCGDGLDWDQVMQRAGQAGLQRMLLLAVALAEDLLGPVSLPPALRRQMAADRVCQGLVATARARLLTRPDEAEWGEPSVFRPSRFIWQAHDALPARLRYLAGTLTAVRPHHFRLLTLPPALFFAYPFVRLVHDYLALPLWRAGKAVLRHDRSGDATAERRAG